MMHAGALPFDRSKQVKTIGILGGMGPQATVSLQQKLIDAVDAHDDRDHVPLLVDMNPQVPSRLDFLLQGQGENPGPTLSRMASRLEAAGAEALAMPCNTAHHFADHIRSAVSIPFINMVELCVDHHAAKLKAEGARVGILASPATEDIGLFKAAFATRNLSAIHPRDRTKLVAAIVAIKSNGVDSFAENALKDAARDCVDQGTECLVVGCSEFSLIKQAAEIGVPVVDTLDLLVNEILRFSGARVKGQA